MPPTLATLVQHSALRLSVLAGQDRLDTPVRWAHASELADPTPYLDGGELLLVTALKLDAEDAETMRAYVRRLVDRGVVGLGFAAGVNYEKAPDALVEAAREAGLPLLEVPRRTPFIAISKVVSAAIAAEQYQAVTAGFDAQRELTGAALSLEGPAALLSRLAAHVDGWAALYDASGAVVATAPSWAARRAGRYAADAERLRDRPAPASAVVSESESGDDRVELQTVGSGRRAKAVLAVGTAAPLGTAERYAVHSAVALLTLTTERSRALQEAEQRLGAAVLRMLLSGEANNARAVAGTLYGGLLDAPIRVIVAEPAGGPAGRTRRSRRPAGGPPRPVAAITEAGTPVVRGQSVPAAPATAVREGAPDARELPDTRPGPAHSVLDDLADAIETAAARNGEAVLVVPDGERLIVLASDGGAAVAACARFAAQAAEPAEHPGPESEPPVVGVSAPAGLPATAVAFKQADQALSVARRRGTALVEHEDVAAGSVLPLLADDAVRAFADGLLRKLYEHDAHGRGDLVASLRAWLSRHGQWDAAAADLGVHRHTLRYRMRRVEEILGRSLDDPDVRMELWLALKTMG
ncbi:PucR family transcriptional regulator [Streptomyces sp. JJ36]|uniref:PucR family transcriptional regulator n=1 Tax=Streptomyces sp. JJ36 TaxID=2736645 RepID=UPI001F26439E|nr:PucR family transcriptional regulator [Streptomyces sp. JJ36]MCF6523245.1 PucR family transcriptional regulator ligand-binding domain-containing protein [Streptomyces sp. JJ36]